jgi:hypothetical protein
VVFEERGCAVGGHTVYIEMIEYVGVGEFRCVDRREVEVHSAEKSGLLPLGGLGGGDCGVAGDNGDSGWRLNGAGGLCQRSGGP